MSDTDPATLESYLEFIRSVPKPQRLMRALELSALVRDLAWQGATLHSGHLGAHAVAERFLLQLYGPDVARRMSAARRSAGVDE